MNENQIEAAARALWNNQLEVPEEPTWDELPDEWDSYKGQGRNYYRHMAERALAAADKSAPLPTIDCGCTYIDYEAGEMRDESYCTAPGCPRAPLPTIDELLDAVNRTARIGSVTPVFDYSTPPKGGRPSPIAWWSARIAVKRSRMGLDYFEAKGPTRYEAIRAACEKAMQRKEAE